jgi:hypothetical protein
MNRIKTVLALTGAVGLFAILPASQASAHHVPGATYTGTHEQGGPVSFTLSAAGQGCVGAQNKVKKLKKKLKNADSAQQKKKLRKKLRRAKQDATLLCNEIRIPTGSPTGSLVNSISIGGPVTGVDVFDLPCPVLGPTETAVYGFEGIYRPEIFSQDGEHAVLLIPGQGSPLIVTIETGGFVFPQPRTAFGSFDLTGDYPPYPNAKCRVDNLRFTATP